ncbi:dihydrofolate reductase [Pseudomaricurvus sp.]|uniref:dihydrofolate reductase n=1 Tax=Pseudomaricurvus sp. TaxID=2004510 RepID=UPI003F6C4220
MTDAQSQPRLALIVAQAENRVIGLDNKMPWHLPEDLQYFKRVTLGKPIIMGRKTFESIGRPLPGRTNIVITRQKDWQADGVEVVSSLEVAIERAAEESPEEVMVIGGAQIYEAGLPLADRVYLTQIHQTFEGDTWFPELGAGWYEKNCESGLSGNSGISYSFLTYDRVTNR